jgi:hypothetical protein
VPVAISSGATWVRPVRALSSRRYHRALIQKSLPVVDHCGYLEDGDERERTDQVDSILKGPPLA